MLESKGPGRPKIELKWEVLDAILQRGATLKDCASIMEISHDIIERRIFEKTGQKFGEYREDRLSKTKLKLIEVALSKAFKGENVMLIFCLKNLAGWSDNNERPQSAPVEIKFNYSLDDKKEDEQKDGTINGTIKKP
jgi:hypothetical protein